ncbi:hypothetical protein UlMin_009542 [Ulmus minor]
MQCWVPKTRNDTKPNLLLIHGIGANEMWQWGEFGFVGYSLAAQFKEAVERVVICCAGVCIEEKDLREGLFRVSDLEEAARILVPQMCERLKELTGFNFFNPLPLRLLPSYLLNNLIDGGASRDPVKLIAKKKKIIYMLSYLSCMLFFLYKYRTSSKSS